MQLPNPKTLLSDITEKIAARVMPDTLVIGIHLGGAQLTINSQIVGAEIMPTQDQHFQPSKTAEGKQKLALENNQDTDHV